MDVGLDELVQSQLMHFLDLIGVRILIEGQDIWIPAAFAQAIGMAIHELATNAGKFGALSNDTGIINLGWDTDPADAANPQFRMSWVERHGPAVTAPVRTGFGSKVIGSMTEFALSASIVRTYETSGFEWRLTRPAETIRNLPQITSSGDQTTAIGA